MNNDRTKDELINRISDSLLLVLKKACLAEISKSGQLSIDSKHDQRKAPIFCEDVTSNFQLKHVVTDQRDIGEDFYISFLPTGQLDDLFERHNISKEIKLVITNGTGECNEILSDAIDVDNLVARVIIGEHPKTTDRTSEELISFYEGLSKALLFTFLR